MDRLFLQAYNQELQHLRKMGGEFAQEFPKIAGRLALSEFECVDPYVERLLEGFAFLTARVQRKLQAEFPRFTQSILDTVYPHYLPPTPSMVVAQFNPNVAEKDLADGFQIKRGEVLRSIIGKGDRTPCEYHTAHTITLWPIEITDAGYYTREINTLEPPDSVHGKAAIRLRLRTKSIPFSKIQADDLTFFLRGPDELPMQIYEQIFAHGRYVIVQSPERPVKWHEVLPAKNIKRVGFSNEEALLPVSARSFQGYRLIQEYFAFYQRFMFFRIHGLSKAFRHEKGTELDLIVMMNQEDLELEDNVMAPNFALYCTPAVNLFHKRTDRIHLSDRFSEYHVVPDRTRPMDFEVYQVLGVTGHGLHAEDEQKFRPFYASTDFDADDESGAYFVVNRMPRMPSQREKQRGRRSSYAGSETFISLVDAKAAPYSSNLRQLSVQTLCTNRDLPLTIPLKIGSSDFTMDSNAPIINVVCIEGPTTPRPSRTEGSINWRAINHLSLNYLSLVHDNSMLKKGVPLRDFLKLYANEGDPQVRKQLEGVLSAESRPISRRLQVPGPVFFARGLEVSVTFDEEAFEGTGIFILGAVLDCFFAKYVSINSFTETVVKTKQRGEIMRWPARLGMRHIL